VNPYGYFDEEAREYVITRPDTPTPWINYLGAGRYGGIISNTAGGYSFDRDPRNRRVSRYRYNAIPDDQPALPLPARSRKRRVLEPDLAACPARPGFLRMSARHRLHEDRRLYGGISSEILYFVPPVPKTRSAPASSGS